MIRYNANFANIGRDLSILNSYEISYATAQSPMIHRFVSEVWFNLKEMGKGTTKASEEKQEKFSQSHRMYIFI